MGYRLGVDLGTTFTAAAVADAAGARILALGNRALQVPSVLFLQEDGTFLVGEAAERRAATEPDRAVREFKRRVGDPVPILLHGQPHSPQSLTARLLAWVVAVATEREGSPPDQVVLTHPANWGGFKRELFDQVAQLADVPQAVTVTEPEAAAAAYADRARVPAGGRLAVYDLGGGTFDVCVLEKREQGFAILGHPDGVEHLGGIDFDHAIFAHVVESLGETAEALDVDDPAVAAALNRLRRDCVDAKEALSTDVETVVPVALPTLSTTVRLTRAEVETLIRPALEETLAAMRRALRSAGTEASELSAVVLVGGSSRIPLVSQLIQSELGVTVALNTHPKHDVALGAVLHGQTGTVPVPAAGRSGRPGSGVDAAAVPPGDSERRPRTWPFFGRGRREQPVGDLGPRRTGPPRRALVAAAAVVAAVAAIGMAWYVVAGRGNGGTSRTTDAALPDDRMVVPLREGSGDLDLVVVNTRGEPNRRVLVNDPGDQWLPALSPDRRFVAYVDRADQSLIKWVPVIGHPRPRLLLDKQVAGRCTSRPAWGAQETLALVCKTPAGRDGLYLTAFSPDGPAQDMHQVLSFEKGERVSDVALSPDGRHASVTVQGGRRSGIVEVDTSTGEPVQRTHSDDADAVWRPGQEDQWAFRRRLSDKDAVILLAGWKNCPRLHRWGQYCRVTTLGSGFNQDPTWSPDGTEIAFKSGPITNAAIEVVVLNGSWKPTPVLKSGAEAPAWSSR